MTKTREETLVQTALRRATGWALAGFSASVGGLTLSSAINAVELKSLALTFATIGVSTAVAFITRFTQVVSEGLARGEEKIHGS